MRHCPFFCAVASWTFEGDKQTLSTSELQRGGGSGNGSFELLLASSLDMLSLLAFSKMGADNSELFVLFLWDLPLM